MCPDTGMKSEDDGKEEHVRGGRFLADQILITGLVAAGVLFAGVYLLQHAGRSGADAVVEISVAGEVIERYPLDQDAEAVISGVDGGTNHFYIQDGQAWVDAASCPDHICVRMGKISREGQSIVCLPNQVVVEIVSGR